MDKNDENDKNGENDKNDEKENVFFWNNLGQWMTLSGVFERL